LDIGRILAENGCVVLRTICFVGYLLEILIIWSVLFENNLFGHIVSVWLINFDNIIFV
jgi:hypothetical protein